jgi:hypothetical protein
MHHTNSKLKKLVAREEEVVHPDPNMLTILLIFLMGTIGCHDEMTDKEAALLNWFKLLELIFTNVAFGTHLPTIFEGCVVGFDPYPN